MTQVPNRIYINWNTELSQAKENPYDAKNKETLLKNDYMPIFTA